MSAVQLFSIGNALVDEEYQVSDAFLHTAGLSKGTMQLVSQEQQNQLLQRLDQAQYQGQASGGSAANTTVGFSALGGTSFYACRVGNDTLGAFYLDDLNKAQVRTSAQSISEGVTGRCIVLITPDGERTMCTFLGITSELAVQHIDWQPLLTAQWLYIEGYLATSPTAQQAVTQARQLARQSHVKIALSLSDPAMVQYARSGLEHLVGDGVDILFCNQQEALTYAKKDTVDEALEHLLHVAECVAITLGADGVLVANRAGQKHKVGTQTVTVKDTNGAGDGFAAGFLFALQQGATLEQAAVLANRIAGAIVERYGPRLPLIDYARYAI